MSSNLVKLLRGSATATIDLLDKAACRIEHFESALHASAPEGYKCSDCEMDKEACPRCYTAWWQNRHPNTKLV